MKKICRSKGLIAFCCLSAVLFIACLDVTVYAQNKPNLHVGALEIHPVVYYRGTYDTNIYLETKGRENGDYINDIGLGVGLKMPLVPERGEDFVAEASYRADIMLYSRESSRNRVDHDVQGSLDCTFANDLKFKLKEHFIKTAEPPSNEFTALDKRYKNTLETSLAYSREKITLEGGYTMIRDGYNVGKNLDKYDNRFTGIAYFHMLPKTSLFGEYDIGTQTYDVNTPNSDSVYQEALVGVTGEILPKVTGSAKGGFRYVDYKRESDKDFSGIALYGDLKYTMTERTDVILSGEKTTVDSSDAANSYYEANLINLDLTHQLLERFWFTGGGTFEYYRYLVERRIGGETGKRNDLVWGVRSGLKYEIKEWIFALVDYAYKQRHSRFGVYNYKDHRISGQLLVRF